VETMYCFILMLLLNLNYSMIAKVETVADVPTRDRGSTICYE